MRPAEQRITRAKAARSGNRVWVYGGYCCWEKRMLAPVGPDSLAPDEIVHVIVRNGFVDWNMPRELEAVEIDPETLGDYIGVDDADGRKIFEGDIVEMTTAPAEQPEAPKTTIGYIRYAPESAQYLLMEANRAKGHAIDAKAAKYRVLGNMVDDIDLLRKAAAQDST